jgi:para-aminobenzoate synthetase/4-amino-4-deoxychorismate lyase
LDEQGRLHLWYSRFRLQEKKIRRAVISRHRLDPGDIFLYHKTTRRELYDKEYRFWRRRGYFDVIFRNRRNEFTEGAISNIIIQKGGQYFTPPVSSGLLCGIFRRHLIGKLKVREKVIYLADIKKAERVFLCNCLRGLTEVKISNVYSCRTF